MLLDSNIDFTVHFLEYTIVSLIDKAELNKEHILSYLDSTSKSVT